ncbi:MAG: hypothetical protein RIT81_22935 [Deltaproteobacteria bacterium]
MTRTRTFLASLLLLGGALACGGNTLEGVEDLPRTNYPRGVPFRMTVMMTACSDACSEYEEADCSVDVNEDDKEISVSASVCFDRVMDECPEICGPRVNAHCEIPPLDGGTYTVTSDNFTATIDVE